MKVALVHEFLTQFGGAERVLLAFLEMFPDAKVYTLVYNHEKLKDYFGRFDIRVSFLQKLPGMPHKYKWYLPAMTWATENFDLSGYDLVISDSSAFAKGVRVKKPTVHVCYCHTPTRYIWESRDEYLANLPHGPLIKKFAEIYLRSVLQAWDWRAAQGPDFLIANSKTVKDRIQKYYGRSAEVIYPPVDTDFFHPVSDHGDYFLAASRIEPYKRIDLAISAFSALGMPLKVAGEGSAVESLKKTAGPNVEFLGRVSDQRLRQLYSGARAFVFPALEDAGMMVVESLACGTPVIGLNRGGTAEFINDSENGVLFGEQTVEDLKEAVLRFEKLNFDPDKIRSSALDFSIPAFREKFFSVLKEHGVAV